MGMSTIKTHFAIMAKDGVASACGRGARMDTSTFRVTCGSCIIRNVFQEEHQKAVWAREEAFHAQVPTTVVPQFGRVNDDGVMECKCGGVLWRERPRSLFSYHYVCAACGSSVHPMTESGMCS